MFEDKRRARKRRYIFLTIFLLFVAAGFGIGYYLNSGPGVNVEGDQNNAPPTTQLKIPESLKNPSVTPPKDNEPEDIEEGPAGQTSTPNDGVMKESTKFIFRTHFTMCGHNLETTATPTAEEMNMNRDALQVRYPDWIIGLYSPSEIVFTREYKTICPRHYIIGIDNGCIAIFVYNEKGEKILKERTDITTNNLPPEDLRSLESGIIADNEDDLSQKLEGFSN